MRYSVKRASTRIFLVFVKSERKEQKNNYSRPDLNTSFLMVADNAHSSFTKLDDAFLLQLLNCLDQT
jgi:hypothetical protein